MIGAIADRAHHFERAAGQIGTGGIGDGLDVGERHMVEPVRVVVDVEGSKATVRRLHAHHPVRPDPHRVLFGELVVDRHMRAAR